jgi:hypothetical protein
MNSTIIAALVRHILTGLAGVFAAKYAVDGATMDAIIGGATALVGVVWSVWDKKKVAAPAA